GPDSVTLNPSPSASVAEGFSLTVTCAATGCNPPCSYAWTRGNQQISSTSQLKLTNINRSQTENVYTCTATNSLIPKSETKQFTLTVYYGPDSVQLNTTSPLTVKEGEDVAVSCEATNCSPSCSFKWMFKSQSKSTSSVLSLNNIQRSAAGDYTCTARNTNTQKSLDKTITLDVQYDYTPPIFDIAQEESILELRSNQEETDSRVVLYCIYAAEQGYQYARVRSSDSDIFWIFLYHTREIDITILFDTGHGNKNHRINITNLSKN
ncbi:CD166 antigen homolog, partial [Gigantopelta aegis]|uniref:CD166 antigen homolog n=1 Tax=Gigantopelta aegis TaxID=1735272 RepID=UPI001B887CEC